MPAAAPARARSKQFRCEYDVVVCHANVIRYFVLRALQLPPEAWLRLGSFNGSFALLRISPLSGAVCLESFGNFGHLAPEETTFGMAAGLEHFQK